MQRHQNWDECVGSRIQGLRQPSHWLHGRPHAPAHHTHARWVADVRNPSAREHLWCVAGRSAYTTASSADVHLIMSLRSSHLVGDHCLDFGEAPEWAGHLAGAGFALPCWLCSASAYVVMRRVYGTLLVAMLVVCRVCAESWRVREPRWLASCMGFVWVHADSLLRCVASPFHSFGSEKLITSGNKVEPTSTHDSW